MIKKIILILFFLSLLLIFGTKIYFSYNRQNNYQKFKKEEIKIDMQTVIKNNNLTPKEEENEEEIKKNNNSLFFVFLVSKPIIFFLTVFLCLVKFPIFLYEKGVMEPYRKRKKIISDEERQRFKKTTVVRDVEEVSHLIDSYDEYAYYDTKKEYLTSFEYKISKILTFLIAKRKSTIKTIFAGLAHIIILSGCELFFYIVFCLFFVTIGFIKTFNFRFFLFFFNFFKISVFFWVPILLANIFRIYDCYFNFFGSINSPRFRKIHFTEEEIKKEKMKDFALIGPFRYFLK